MKHDLFHIPKDLVTIWKKLVKGEFTLDEISFLLHIADAPIEIVRTIDALEYCHDIHGIEGRSVVKALWKRILGRNKNLPSTKTEVKYANYIIGPITLDLVYQTDEGSFIIKEFRDKSATLQDLKETTDLIRQNFPKVSRVLYVAKEYEPSLQGELLNESMTKDIKSGFPIDLIIEEKVGYSMLWIG